MATDMINGYIYFIESDAGDNQDWIPTVDDINLAVNFAGQEGTEYCKIEIPRRWRKLFNTGIVVTDSGGGSSFDLRSSRRAYQVLSEGIETSKDNADLIEGFFMSDRHTSGSAATFVRYYLIIKMDTTDYVQFTDSGSVRRDYCKGVVTTGEEIWQETESQTALVRLNWRSVW